MCHGITAVNSSFWLKPNLRHYFEALTDALRWKEGHMWQPTAVGVFSSNAKGVAMLLLHSSGVPYVPSCAKGLLGLIANI